MKKSIRKITLLLILSILILSSKQAAQAVLQSNGRTSSIKTIDQWMLQIRQMESPGGALGLTETVKTIGLNSTTGSNNLDIHMEKNTEYGAMAILSASSYGNPNKIQSGGTTTGNKTGVYMKLNKEWVAAGTISNSTTYRQAASKYKDLYTTTYVAKFGDTITETKGWHGSNSSEWLYDNTSSGLLRAYSGSLFSYYGYGNGNNDANAAGFGYDKTWSSRAVVVVGSGL